MGACAQVRLEDGGGASGVGSSGGVDGASGGGDGASGGGDGGADPQTRCVAGALTLHGSSELVPLADAVGHAYPVLTMLASGDVLLAVNGRWASSNHEVATLMLSPWETWPIPLSPPSKAGIDQLSWSQLAVGSTNDEGWLVAASGTGTYLIEGIPSAPTEPVRIGGSANLDRAARTDDQYLLRWLSPEQGLPLQTFAWPSEASDIVEFCKSGVNKSEITAVPGAFLVATHKRSEASCNSTPIEEFVEVSRYHVDEAGELASTLGGVFGDEVVYHVSLTPRSDGAWLILTEGPDVALGPFTTYAQRLDVNGGAVGPLLPLSTGDAYPFSASPAGDGFVLAYSIGDSTSLEVFDAEALSVATGVLAGPIDSLALTVSPDRGSLLVARTIPVSDASRVELTRFDCTGL